ncbi:MAG TPA: hypothetical protein VFP59_05580 [Candidatus Angelobacter sp.]|nr:hypothetical protein [Candidatus Angelobacter sp.]
MAGEFVQSLPAAQPHACVGLQRESSAGAGYSQPLLEVILREAEDALLVVPYGARLPYT